ncbi:MAG: histidine kinase N-terminal 7TM domain-containing protein [Candidatus Desantisbacteria bacterium]
MILLSFFGIVTIVTNLLLISFALLAKKSTNVSRSFSLLAASITIWMIGIVVLCLSATTEGALFCAQVFYVGCLFIPSFYLQFVCSLTQTHDKLWKILKILTYILSGILLIINILGEVIHHVSCEHSFYQPIAGKFYYLYNILFGFCFAASIYLLWKRLSTAIVLEKRRLHWMLGITGMGIIAGVIDSLSIYEIHVYSLGSVGLSVFGLFIAFVVIKYKLIEFELNIKKQHILSLSQFIIAGILLILIHTFCYYSLLAVITGACLAGIIFYLLTNAIQRLTESYMLKDILEEKGSLDMAGVSIPAAFDWQTLFTSIQNVADMMKITNMAITLLDKEMDEYCLDFSTGFTNEERRAIRLKGNKGVIPWIKNEKKVLMKEGLRLNPKFEYVWEAIDNDLELLKSTRAMPIINKDRLIGILFIGDDENISNIEVFAKLDNELATAIGNTLSYDVRTEYFFGIMEALIVSIKAKDKDTTGCKEREAGYAAARAIRLGFTVREAEDAAKAVILHDIEGYGINVEAILQKTGRLSREEIEEVKSEK